MIRERLAALMAVCLLLSALFGALAVCGDGVCMACAQAEEAVEPALVYTFADPVVEKAVLLLLGKGEATMEDLARMTQLRLEVGDGFVLDDLAYMPALQKLQISGAEDALPDIDFAPLAGCMELKELVLGDLGELHNMDAMAALYDLWMNNIHLTDAQAAAMGEMKKLEILFISDAPITDLSWIAGCEALREVTVSFTGITSADGLEPLEKLEFVAVEHNAAQPDLSFLLGRGIQSWTPMGEYLPFEEWYAEYQYGGFVEPGLLDEKEEAREGYHQHRGGQVH